MQGCVEHQGKQNVDREPSLCGSYLECHKPLLHFQLWQLQWLCLGWTILTTWIGYCLNTTLSPPFREFHACTFSLISRAVGDHSVEVAGHSSWVIKHLTLYLNNTNINKSNSLIRCLYFYPKKWLTLIDLWVEQRRWTPENRRGTSRLKKDRTKTVKTGICACKTHYDVKHFIGENMEVTRRSSHVFMWACV